MNKKQWKAFGIGLILLGLFFLFAPPSCFLLEDSRLISCSIHSYIFGGMGFFSLALGIISLICGKLEKK